ncbi:von Willebrand factor type A domain protein [Novipirellula galeiformis]|uniref:von Willebrand factor type A domain protein n=1 Tax=Novipirellula galeiformis TaxID=2528004 RepID=A0A5C6CMN5_9BACT|nr:VWA domain-containing protein [Novipirellula galeiformis]TWU24406.1 von Willebrand factor type A domain protein [Novipirellula galeiformis]
MFESPWFLWLLLIVPVIAWQMFHRKQAWSITFSSTRLVSAIRPSWRQRIAWLPDLLTLLALVAMIVALARPRMGREQTVIDSEGIAMEIVVDRSGSMQAMDFQIDGQHVDRLTAIKNVASSFIKGDEVEAAEGGITGRASDLIGLITFAGYADAMTPPTLDHAFLLAQLNHAKIVTQRDEDGTAIGDAISLAVEKLQSLDASEKSAVKSKVIILMTDGENTAGEFDPVQAAELAKTMGIKVYAIGVGTKGRAPFPSRHPFTGEATVQWMDVNIDEETLRKIAETTGAEYFRATDTKSLTAIYDAIDQLEKTKIESHRFTDYQELAVQSFTWNALSFPPIALLALFLIAASVMVKHGLIQTWV